MISTPTGSWIRLRRRRDRIQLPDGVETMSNFSLMQDWTVRVHNILSGFHYT